MLLTRSLRRNKKKIKKIKNNRTDLRFADIQPPVESNGRARASKTNIIQRNPISDNRNITKREQYNKYYYHQALSIMLVTAVTIILGLANKIITK